MSPDLDAALVRDFPLTFRDRNNPDRDGSPMHYGFCCGDGWEPLIRKGAGKLEPMLEAMPESDRPTSSQVKEKFGALRWYWDDPMTTDMDAIVDFVERESAMTCEECAAYGRLRSRRAWIRTLCDACDVRTRT
jgi:hypothetical protein